MQPIGGARIAVGGGRQGGGGATGQQVAANCCQVASLGATFFVALAWPTWRPVLASQVFFLLCSPQHPSPLPPLPAASTFRSLSHWLAVSCSPALPLSLLLSLQLLAAKFFRFLDYFLKCCGCLCCLCCCLCRLCFLCSWLGWKLKLKRDSRHIILHDFSMWHLGANPLTDTPHSAAAKGPRVATQL